MNLRHFECFRTVMVSGTMTRAAEILGLAQPTVSQLIAALEREIGFPLFIRRKGRLQPTIEADYLYDQVSRMMDGYERTLDTVKQIRNRSLGSLVVATYPGLAFHILPHIVSEFLAERPDVRIRIISKSSQRVRDLIPSQQFDVAVTELPIDHAAINIEPMKFECVCLLSADHPLAEYEVITPKLLDGVPFVALDREHLTWHSLSRAFQDAGAEWNLIAETQFFDTCCCLASLGVGVTLTDPFNAEYYQKSGAVIRKFRPKIMLEIGILCPQERPRSSLAEDFIELIKEHLAPYSTR